MNGAEPVYAETLRQFTEAFAEAGLRPEALMPVYGLAEATLLVSGGSARLDGGEANLVPPNERGGSEHATPVIRWIDRTTLGGARVADAH